MCLDGGSGDDYFKKLRQEEEARQLAIRQGTKQVNQTFKPFNKAFFDKRAQSYVDFATPQLEDQRTDANNALTFALARAGTLDSTIRTGQESELQKLYGVQKQNIADQGLNYATEARTGVEDARSDLLRTLESTANAKQAASNAVARAGALTEAPAYSPLTQLFTDFTSGLGTQLALERSYSLGSGVKPRYSTGIFGAPSSSVVVSA